MTRRRANTLWTTLSTSLGGAAAGAAGGWLYAKYGLPPEVLEKQSYLVGMYASVGAAIGLIGMRVGLLALQVVRDRDE